MSSSAFKLASQVQKIFIPKHETPNPDHIQSFRNILESVDRLFVLTGAGISTESGIPDYRSADVGRYARSKHRPVLYQDFIKSEVIRQRYWARNFLGWPRFSSIKPNSNHFAIARYENQGKIHTVVTQNVDRLHQKAGSQSVIELHGSGFIVSCLSCKFKIDRETLQDQIRKANPLFEKDSSIEVAPDGDVDISPDVIQSFKAPLCNRCSGPLMPNIVFFGDNVSLNVREACLHALHQSDAILVAGSSLHVFSGYRFVKAAHEAGKPIIIVNIGPTRADDLATLKLSFKCSDILDAL